MVYEDKIGVKRDFLFAEKEPEEGPEKTYSILYAGRLFLAANSCKEIYTDVYEEQMRQFALLHTSTRLMIDFPSTLTVDKEFDLVNDLLFHRVSFETENKESQEDLKKHNYILTIINHNVMFGLSILKNSSSFVVFLYLNAENARLYNRRITTPLIDSLCYSREYAEKKWKENPSNMKFEHYLFKQFIEFVNKREALNGIPREQRRVFEL